MAITRSQQARQMLRVAGAVGREYDRPSAPKASAPKSSPFSGDESRQQYSAIQTQTGAVKGGGRKTPTMGGAGDEGFQTAFITGDEGRKARDRFIAARGPDFTPAFQKRKSGLGGLFSLILGGLTGIPFNLLRGGGNFLDKIKSFNQRLRDNEFARSETLVDYLNTLKNKNKIDTTGLSNINPKFQDDLGNELLLSTEASPIIPKRKPEIDLSRRLNDPLNLLPQITPYQEDVIEDQNEDEQLGDLREIMAADGGMIGGGIMDAAGRQQYFLGKLVKKATRAVKKIVKSPVGKLGLLAAGGFGLNKMFPFIEAGKLTGAGKLFGGGILSLAPFIFGNQEEKDQQDLASLGSVGGNIDPRAYTDPYSVLYGAFKAEGGSMKDEPVAKRTMPLLDMGGKEMDLRAEGGFVPIGRMEKADDVPARLSKNEFVFTADAVRNAGNGDVDKGAEVMYNMMKNLEAGGDVSEESQGLEGARNMFQTAKRLEDVV